VILRLFEQGVNQYNKGDKNTTPYFPLSSFYLSPFPPLGGKKVFLRKSLFTFLHDHGKAERRSCSEVKTGRSKQLYNARSVFPDHITVHVIVVMKGFAIFLDIIGWVYAKQFIELLSEVFQII